MQEKDIQLAIAEAVGHPAPFLRSNNPNSRDMFNGNGELLPDYPHNRDEMQAALLTLTEFEQRLFGELACHRKTELHLSGIVLSQVTGIDIFRMATLPLPVLAEGFLRARGLWREEA